MGPMIPAGAALRRPYGPEIEDEQECHEHADVLELERQGEQRHRLHQPMRIARPAVCGERGVEWGVARPTWIEEARMELYDALRGTFAAREFTDTPLPDDVLYRILDHARFAPSGGNRQGWRVIVVRDQATRDALAALSAPAARRYAAQQQAGENPWNSADPTDVTADVIARTPVPARLTEPLRRAPVVLVVCVDLRVVASTDQYLPRVGVVSGASIYPFAWNILLAARQEGFGGTITTLAVAEEPAIKRRLGIPDHAAVCAVIPLGRPARSLTRLRRKPVPEFAMRERWGGPPLDRP